MRFRIRQSVLSLAVFCVVMGGLISVDERVRERFGDLIWGGNNLAPMGTRLSELAGALGSAIRHQSIENAPLVIFATIGAVLFLFMVRT